MDDLKYVAKELGEDMTEEELKEMIHGANKGSENLTVDRKMFENILSSSNAWIAIYYI